MNTGVTEKQTRIAADDRLSKWRPRLRMRRVEAADDELPEPETPEVPGAGAPGSETGVSFGAGGQQTGQG